MARQGRGKARLDGSDLTRAERLCADGETLSEITRKLSKPEKKATKGAARKEVTFTAVLNALRANRPTRSKRTFADLSEAQMKELAGLARGHGFVPARWRRFTR